jgi:hypothetical protein
MLTLTILITEVHDSNRAGKFDSEPEDDGGADTVEGLDVDTGMEGNLSSGEDTLRRESDGQKQVSRTRKHTVCM